jgi:hypothetical protein
MSLSPPSYSSISIRELPQYSDTVLNRPTSPPPPYVDPTYPSTVIPSVPPRPSQIPTEVNEDGQFIESCCVSIWILFLIVLALFHFVLFFVYVPCPLPKTDLGGIRAYLFLHIIFLVSMIIGCGCKYKHNIAFEKKHAFFATICFSIPFVISFLVIFPWIIFNLNDLDDAIQRPSQVTETYPCSLSLYQLVFGIMICNYILGLPTVVVAMICLYYFSENSGKSIFTLSNTRIEPELSR